jgi:hypothetical protein
MPSRVVRSNLRKKLIETDKALRKELGKAAQEAGKILKRDHEKVVAQWDHKVKFGYVYRVNGSEISANVYAYGANAKIWFFVNDGTKPHIIRPKKSKYLKFQTGYSPRTAKGGFGGPGKATGGWVSAKEVHHPGNQARDFTLQIVNRARPRFRRLTEAAFQKAIRRSF